MKIRNLVIASVLLTSLLAVTSGLLHAMNSNPTYDVTGIWKSNAGDTVEIFQEKDEVNAVMVNSGWAHRLDGRYVSPTKVEMVLIRRTRSGGCEVTMGTEFIVNSASSITWNGVAVETGCGLTAGQAYPIMLTRTL